MSLFACSALISFITLQQITTADTVKIFNSQDHVLPQLHLTLSIGTSTTSLRIESGLPNNQVWFGVAFDTTSMLSNSYGIVYCNSHGIVMDMHMDAYNTPTLLPSQWTIDNHKQLLNGKVIITLSRPNEISSKPNYPNFNTLKQSDIIEAIWAHGTSNTFDTCIKFKTAGVLSSSNVPTKSPTLCGPPDGTTNHCVSYQQTHHKICCLSDPECEWETDDEGYCDNEGGGPDCCYIRPTDAPTQKPTYQPWPTKYPTLTPTDSPTLKPTDSPTLKPTSSPTKYPTKQHTDSPTLKPTTPPTIPERKPVTKDATDSPTKYPTKYPTTSPSKYPTQFPTLKPTNPPTLKPTNSPTLKPTNPPTLKPTNPPTLQPTNPPTLHPTNPPTLKPTNPPTLKPTIPPTTPERKPVDADVTDSPTRKPTKDPTVDRCDCEGGFKTLKFKYMGQTNGVSIRIYSQIGYRTTKTLCSFNGVQRSKVITCDVSSARNYDKTYFKITYPTVTNAKSLSKSKSKSKSKSNDKIPNYRTCEGWFDTTCNRDIVGDIYPNCMDLKVIGWTDMKNKYCDERYSNNALLNKEEIDINDNENIMDSKVVQYGSVGMAVFIIGCFICICIKCVKKFDNMYYGRHRAKSDGIDGIAMIPQTRVHRNTLSMSDSYVVKMNDADFVK